GTFYISMKLGPNPAALVRTYTHTERYGLKPVELVVPPETHRVKKLALLGSYYKRISLVKGEMFSPYLGVISILGLLWMSWETYMRLIRRDPRKLPAPALQCAWIGIYSVIGGLNGLAALLGFALLRASNRHSIFISCIALL